MGEETGPAGAAWGDGAAQTSQASSQRASLSQKVGSKSVGLSPVRQGMGRPSSLAEEALLELAGVSVSCRALNVGDVSRGSESSDVEDLMSGSKTDMGRKGDC